MGLLFDDCPPKRAERGLATEISCMGKSSLKESTHLVVLA